MLPTGSKVLLQVFAKGYQNLMAAITTIDKPEMTIRGETEAARPAILHLRQSSRGGECQSAEGQTCRPEEGRRDQGLEQERWDAKDHPMRPRISRPSPRRVRYEARFKPAAATVGLHWRSHQDSILRNLPRFSGRRREKPLLRSRFSIEKKSPCTRVKTPLERENRPAMSTLALHGKSALVTGGARRIGRAIALNSHGQAPTSPSPFANPRRMRNETVRQIEALGDVRRPFLRRAFGSLRSRRVAATAAFHGKSTSW